jgi:hypothetical protein
MDRHADCGCVRQAGRRTGDLNRKRSDGRIAFGGECERRYARRTRRAKGRGHAARQTRCGQANTPGETVLGSDGDDGCGCAFPPKAQ